MNIPAELFNLTQKDRILKLLQMRGTAGVMVYEIMAPRPTGLGVAQYNARIKELRTLGYSIMNKTPGHFVLNSAKHPSWLVEAPQKPLDGKQMMNWQAMGAWLKGEGPRPETRNDFVQSVQESLI